MRISLLGYSAGKGALTEGGTVTVVWAYALHLEWSNRSWKINEGLRRKLWSKRMSCCCGTFPACCACIRPLAAALLSAICPVHKQLSSYKLQVNLRSALFHNSSGQLPTLCFPSLQVGFTFFVLKRWLQFNPRHALKLYLTVLSSMRVPTPTPLHLGAHSLQLLSQSVKCRCWALGTVVHTPV